MQKESLDQLFKRVSERERGEREREREREERGRERENDAVSTD